MRSETTADLRTARARQSSADKALLEPSLDLIAQAALTSGDLTASAEG